MMKSQRELFSLDEGWRYINCGYMSPLLKSVEEAGIEGLRRKRNPQTVSPDDFFSDGEAVANLFAKLVNGEEGRVALIPSASYGMGIVIQNIKRRSGGTVITVHEEFPSDVYSLHRICGEHQLKLITIHPPDKMESRGKEWNDALLRSITSDTVLINISPIHWADGTLFNLEAIGQRAKEVGALFVVDGTQSVGALDIDVKKCQIDALICAGYKWLLCPYTSGFAYFSNYFDNGKPLEESWLNRIGSENFRNLVNYESSYKPLAGRYNMGEYSNFINLPMMKTALTQILEWTPHSISNYCEELMKPLINFLQTNGFWLENSEYRASHLFGFRLPDSLTLAALQNELSKRKIVLSLRGSAVRVSPHVYNTEQDVAALIEALEIALKTR